MHPVSTRSEPYSQLHTDIVDIVDMWTKEKSFLANFYVQMGQSRRPTPIPYQLGNRDASPNIGNGKLARFPKDHESNN